QVDGGRGADRGARRHGRDVGGVGDEGPRGGGTAAGGGDVDDNRNLGDEDAFDDVAHGGVEPARCVEPDNERFALITFGPRDRLDDHLGRDRLNRAFHREDVGHRLLLGGSGGGGARGRGGSEKEDGGPRSRREAPHVSSVPWTPESSQGGGFGSVRRRTRWSERAGGAPRAPRARR